jgi:hypothetical protein
LSAWGPPRSSTCWDTTSTAESDNFAGE